VCIVHCYGAVLKVNIIFWGAVRT